MPGIALPLIVQDLGTYGIGIFTPVILVSTLSEFVVPSPPVVLTTIRLARAVICGSYTCTLQMSTWVPF